MPKLEPKQIQAELDSGKFRSFYFLYGAEAMKMRELTRRIANAYRGVAVGEGGSNAGNLLSDQFGELSFDGASTTAASVLDELNSLSLGVSEKVILLRNAHTLKDLEALVNEAPNVEFTAKNKESAILIAWAKDLDQRKRSTKILTERAATVACEAIPERDRPAWIRYLMKRRGLSAEDGENADWLVAELERLEPWTLDIVDAELAKFELTPEALRRETFRGSSDERSGERFLEAFLNRNRAEAIHQVGGFAGLPEESFPLIGLLAWNFRMLTSAKLSPHGARSLGNRENLKAALAAWSLDELTGVQRRLTSFDASLKGSGEDPRAAWTQFVNGAWEHDARSKE